MPSYRITKYIKAIIEKKMHNGNEHAYAHSHFFFTSRKSLKCFFTQDSQEAIFPSETPRTRPGLDVSSLTLQDFQLILQFCIFY